MRSLRTRLLISHTLPLIIIILLTGFALDYLVETQILLPNIADELTNEAKLLSELTSLQSDLWEDSETAQAYLTTLEPLMEAHVTLFDDQGKYLASTEPDIQNLTDTTLINIDHMQTEGTILRTTYGVKQEASVVEVFVPVYKEIDNVIGGIQMTYHLENVYDQVLTLRRGIIGILAIGVFLGSGIAVLVSANLNRALLNINSSIQMLAKGKTIEVVDEAGPEEIRDLMRTVNSFVYRLQNMETTRRKLLVNLVHELGRPLGAMLPAVQALQTGAAQNKDLRKELLAGIEDEINILRRLLNDLTGLYDQFTGTFLLEKRVIYLSDKLPNIVLSQKEAALGKGLKWFSDINPDIPLINVDPDRLAQAIGNLIDNAIKFTPPGGEILFSAGYFKDDVWIRIKDSGPGIPIDDQEFLFTRFFQGRSETRFPQGMGLGLSIAQDLVVAHKGRLEFESYPGKGSIFTIWLPRYFQDE